MFFISVVLCIENHAADVLQRVILKYLLWMNHDYKEIYVVDVGGDVAKRFQALSVEHQTTDVLQHVVVSFPFHMKDQHYTASPIRRV